MDLCNAKSYFQAYAGRKGSDQSEHPLTESLDNKACMYGEQIPGCYFAHAQDDMKPRILCIFRRHFFA